MKKHQESTTVGKYQKSTINTQRSFNVQPASVLESWPEGCGLKIPWVLSVDSWNLTTRFLSGVPYQPTP